MKRQFFISMLLSVFVLFSCSEHRHGGEPVTTADSLSVRVYDARYKSVAIADSLVAALDNLSAGMKEQQMVARNAMAYSALMKMDYAKATTLYNSVIDESECEIEKLVADVGLMIVCYRVSANRDFFDYRARAVERIKRISEDAEYLTLSDKARFERARIEFGIVSMCYFSNLSMLDDMKDAMEILRDGMNNEDDLALKVYAGMMLANSNSDAAERLRLLSGSGLKVSQDKGYTWLAANHKLLLAITLRDNSALLASLPENISSMQQPGDTLASLPYILAADAAEGFRHYGDKYMMIEAMAVAASCRTQSGDYEGALALLADALNEINGYYTTYYPDSVDFAYNVLEQNDIEIEPYMVSDNGMYNIPECLLSVRREASCAFAGMGDKYASDINRESYLMLLRTTRINKQMESNASSAKADISRLDNWLTLVIIAILLLLTITIIYNRRKRRHKKSYSSKLRCLPDVCRQLFSSLPQDVASKEELQERIIGLLNSGMIGFLGNVQFAFTPMEGNPGCCYSFAMKYIGGGADTLYVKTSAPLTPQEYALLEMLVPYISVAVAEGMRLADISDEQERLEEMRQASAVYLAEHKRENLMKRVSVSVAMSMRPYIDRIINELRALPAVDSVDAERKLGYVTELTEKLDDLNIILERWIKMRQGEMHLQVESFSLANLFAIIEKSRTLLESRGITFTVGDGTPVVKADKALTLFMINTLVDNAAKFTPQGGSVALECINGDGYVEVAVTDSGVGISQADIDRILNEKVYDAATIGSDNSNLPAKSKGGGFGLMNCKGIIDKYRKADAIFSVCSMDIKSEKGKGSRFSFRLPKGIMRCITLMLMLLPFGATASDGLFGDVRYYADSVYSSNVHGNHDEAFVQARNAIDLLNSYYKYTIGGSDTLLVSGDTYAELKWWREGLFADEMTEDIFYNILDIRNELAVASLALQRWQPYRYNNYIYSTLYRLVDEDKGIVEQYERTREMLGIRKALIAILCFVLIVLLVYLLVSYLRHSVIGKANEHLVQNTNLKLLELVTASSANDSRQMLQGVANEIYASLGERMRIKRVALLLNDGQQGERVAAAAPVPFAGGRADVYLHGVIDDGQPYISSDFMLRVMPLYATVSGNEVLVGALEVMTERPLSENEALSVELVARFVASIAYHRTVRVANSYMTLEELEEETERIRLEENRLHVQNMVMDNCLSVIKHETVYYPSRVRDLAMKAQQNSSGRGEDVAAMRELMDYYNSVFGILANCAKRELDTMCFTPSRTSVAQLFDDARRYAGRMATRRGLDVSLIYEPTDASANVDAGLVAYLFEALIDAALKVEKPGTLLLRATSAADSVKIELIDNRRTLSSDEVAELFTPSRYNIGQRNELLGMEYLIAKEIVRMHEDYTGRHGSRMEARSDVEGTVILFTLPK